MRAVRDYLVRDYLAQAAYQYEGLASILSRPIQARLAAQRARAVQRLWPAPAAAACEHAVRIAERVAAGEEVLASEIDAADRFLVAYMERSPSDGPTVLYAVDAARCAARCGAAAVARRVAWASCDCSHGLRAWVGRLGAWLDAERELQAAMEEVGCGG